MRGKYRRNLSLLSFLVIAGIVILSLHYTNRVILMQKAQSVALAVVSNGQRAARWLIHPVASLPNSLRAARKIRRENSKLKTENKLLRRKLRDLKDYQEENKRLKKLLHFSKSLTERTVAAHVIGYNITNLQSALVIDKGYKDGLATNMPVLTERGLVGKIYQTSPHASLVMLINDQDSGVAVELKDSGVFGVAEGRANGEIWIRYLPREVKVSKGEEILTSGNSDIYPRGIKVGEVTKVIADQYSLEKRVKIKPSENLGRLNEVLVVSKRKFVNPFLGDDGK